MRDMRRASLLVLAVTLAIPPVARAESPPLPEDARVRAWQTGLLAPDRLRHASLGFALGIGIGIATRSPAAAGLGSLALGAAKEAGDARRDRFDAVDLLADALGAGAAAVVTSALRH